MDFIQDSDLELINKKPPRKGVKFENKFILDRICLGS